MPTTVLASPRAEQQIDRLRRKDFQRFDQFIKDLGARGCAALAYRLTGPSPLGWLCVKHLIGQIRVIVGFKTAEEAWVLLVGPHDKDPGVDVYSALYALAGAELPDTAKRTKPNCCDDSGYPPALAPRPAFRIPLSIVDPLALTLSAKNTALGGWCSMPNLITAELMARQPLDYVCIDTQHGWVTDTDLLPMLQAIQSSTMTALVRVAANTPDAIGRALDYGADGVIIPMVNSAEEAERAVQACRYPPQGQRSLGQARAAGHLDPSTLTPEGANARILCLVMIESANGVKEVANIAQVPGIDGVYVGPTDLALTHQMTPTFRLAEAEHLELLDSILDTCAHAGIPAGLHCPAPAEAGPWHQRGFRMLTVATDLQLFRQALTHLSQELTTLRHQTRQV